MRPSEGFRAVALGTVLAVAAALPPAAAGAPASPGPAFAGTRSPTATTGQSKVWWHDGLWWANMWDAQTGTFRIFRLTADGWAATDAAVDDRPRTLADVLSDGHRLYVLSHKFTGRTDAGEVRLYRFSYDLAERAYAVDQGFPVDIGDYGAASIVLDKDSTGQLWAAWVQPSGVHVNRSVCTPVCDDARWGEAFSLGVTGATNVSADDVAALVAARGEVLVAWSSVQMRRFFVSTHPDGGRDLEWMPSTELPVTPANDSISLKADGQGRVFAAVSTGSRSQGLPRVVLLSRNAATGEWSASAAGLYSDRHEHPTLVIDEELDAARVFARAPGATPGSGAVYEKSAPLDAPSFPAGRGTRVIESPDANLNQPTSTKQPVDGRTGLVVLAADSSRQRYWYVQRTTLPPAGGAEEQLPFLFDQAGAPPARARSESASSSFPLGASSPTEAVVRTAAVVLVPALVALGVVLLRLGRRDVDLKTGLVGGGRRASRSRSGPPS